MYLRRRTATALAGSGRVRSPATLGPLSHEPRSGGTGMSKLRNFQLKGGPYDGYKGDFVEKHQAMTMFKGCPYLRAPYQPSRRFVRFVYNKEQHDTMLRAKGIDPETGDIKTLPKVSGNARTLASINGEWVASRAGEILGTIPTSKLTTTEETVEWVNQFLSDGESIGNIRES